MPLFDFTSNHPSWHTTAIISAVATLTSGVIAAGVIFNLRKTKIMPQKWIRVGKVKSLHIYPVKGCKSISPTSATATRLGLQLNELTKDRIFMIVDKNFVFQVQKAYPKLALIHYSVDVTTKTITLKAEDTEISFKLPDDSKESRKKVCIFDERNLIGLDCGDRVSSWIQNFLGPEAKKNELRLVYHGNLKHTQRTLSDLQKQFSTTSASDLGTFQNYTSYLLVGEESVMELNKHLTNPVTFENFRPSILVNELIEPFSEINWNFVRIGQSTILKSSKPCERCSITTVNQTTGIRDKAGEPLRTLLRLKPAFDDKEAEMLLKNKGIMGLQMGMFEESPENTEIQVGDPVYVAML